MDVKEGIFYQYASLKDRDFPLFSFKKFSCDFQSNRPKRSHIRGQFIFPEGGAVKVYVLNHYYLVPSSQTIWIPPNVEHEMIFSPGSCPITFSLIDPFEASRFISVPAIYNVTALVTELIRKTVEFCPAYKKNSPEFRLVSVLIDELLTLKESKLKLPLVEDERLQKVTSLLQKDSSKNYDHEALSKVACMSKRNMDRLFEKETGMTIGEWRRQQKILLAIEKLDSGSSVSAVSIELGYKSLSAFIETFKEATGKTPGTFLVK